MAQVRHPLHPRKRKGSAGRKIKPGQHVSWLYGGAIPHVHGGEVREAAPRLKVTKLYGGAIPHPYVA